MLQTMTRTERYQHWQEIMKDWEASNEPQERYCQGHDINYHQFKSWRSRILTDRKKDLSSSDHFIPLQLKSNCIEQVRDDNNRIRIELQSGIKIFIPMIPQE